MYVSDHVHAYVCVCVRERERERERERTHTVARIFGDEHVHPESVTEPVPSLIQYAEILTWQGETRKTVDISRRAPCAL